MVVVPKFLIRYRGKCVPPGSRVEVDEKTGRQLLSSRLAKILDGKAKSK